MSGQVPGKPLLWEHLVTDGHVRAARIRRALPWLLVTAAILTVVGWIFLTSIDRPRARNNRGATLQAEVQRQRDRVTEVFGGIRGVRIPNAAEVQRLRPATELGDLQARILQALNRSDELPRGAVKAVQPAAFWRAPWPYRDVIAAEGSGVRIVGAIVNADGQPMRWLGVFRKKGSVWRAVAIQAPGFIGPPETEMIEIETIPVTLGSVLATGD